MHNLQNLKRRHDAFNLEIMCKRLYIQYKRVSVSDDFLILLRLCATGWRNARQMKISQKSSLMSFRILD